MSRRVFFSPAIRDWLRGATRGCLLGAAIAVTFAVFSTRDTRAPDRPVVTIDAVAWAEPGKYSPNAYRGETFTRVLTWKDSSGALVNLTGYVSKLEIREPASNTLVLSLTDGAGLTLGGAAGTITWDMTPVQTLALPLGSKAYDLRLTSGGGQVVYLIAGYLNVKETRTR